MGESSSMAKSRERERVGESEGVRESGQGRVLVYLGLGLTRGAREGDVASICCEFDMFPLQ